MPTDTTDDGYAVQNEHREIFMLPGSLMPVLSCLSSLDNCEGIANPKLTFEVKGGTHGRQTPFNHNGNTVTQHIGLLHAVCCQHNGSLPSVLLDDVPGEPATASITVASSKHRCCYGRAVQCVMVFSLRWHCREQQICLLHAVCCQHNCSVPSVLLYHIPGEPATALKLMLVLRAIKQFTRGMLGLSTNLPAQICMLHVVHYQYNCSVLAKMLDPVS